MRPCIPATSAPSATGRQSGELQKGLACPKARPNRSRHWYADPRTRGGPLHRSAPGAFFSYTGRGAFSFWRNQKENGGRIAQPSSWLNSPGRQIAAPTFLRALRFCKSKAQIKDKRYFPEKGISYPLSFISYLHSAAPRRKEAP